MKAHRPHAILVAYPLQGHVIPSVNLAMKLASRGFTITFINTDSIHQQTLTASRLHEKPYNNKDDVDLFSGARDAGLDVRYLTVPDGLPIGFDRSFYHDQFMAALLHVFSAHVEDIVGRVIQSNCELPVRFLIADTFFVWPATLAKKLGLLYVSFWTEPAVVFNLYYHRHLLHQNGHFDCPDVREDPIDYIPGVRRIERKDLTSYLQAIDTSSVCHQIIFKAFDEAREADFVVCNTVDELEHDTISALNTSKPFYSVGPIFAGEFSGGAVPTSIWAESDCMPWLKSKAPDSVLYVSFGSYAHVSKEVLGEIARGLVLSGASFVWVLRPDIVSSDDPHPLPVEVEREMENRGIVVPWCSQTAVLSHPAIGGFLTHCGWNSILESIWCGVPLLCFPLLTDQFTNRKLVVDDWRIGINLIDGKEVTREVVSKNIRRLMSADCTYEMRQKVNEIKMVVEGAVAAGGSSEKNIDRLVLDLVATL